MGTIHEIAVTIVSFFALVVFMVVFHELGHFLAAKVCKVRVEAFSIGFGKRLFGFKIGETEYKFCLLPLGGFVKMTGEQPGEDPHFEDPGSFTTHPRWQRIIIGLAGPAANFLLAFGLMTVYYSVINEVPKLAVKTTTIDWVVPNSPAAQAGFQPGDQIVRFDTVQTPDWIQVQGATALNLNQVVLVRVHRDSKYLDLRLHIPSAANPDEFEFVSIGLLPQITNLPIGIQSVEPRMAGDLSGIKAGDQIESVDGLHLHYIGTLQAYMEAQKGAPMNLVLLRSGGTVLARAKPTLVDHEWRLGIEVASVPISSEPLPLGTSIRRAANFCATNSTMVEETLLGLFTHRVSFSQLSGPIGIARVARNAAESAGWLPKFYTAAVISINLGVFNLLPFPILDGGLLAMLLFESIRRKDISIATKERIFQFAFTILVVFFIVVFISDMTKLHYVARLK